MSKNNNIGEKTIHRKRAGIIVDEFTGAQIGRAEITVKRRVDITEFVKFFKNSILTVVSLKPSSLYCLLYMMSKMEFNNPKIRVDIKDLVDTIQKCGGKMSAPSAYRGIIELIEKKFITEEGTHVYMINTDLAYNGNRINIKFVEHDNSILFDET